MDAAPPFASNMIFDAAFATGVNYGSMGTWSVPMDEPKLGLGIENSYTEPMTKYNFDRHEAWKQQGNMAQKLLTQLTGIELQIVMNKIIHRNIIRLMKQTKTLLFLWVRFMG